MTNADKYLKDGVDVYELIRAMTEFYMSGYSYNDNLTYFFNHKAKPTLTEDEKVILRHINTINIDRIGRHDCGDLILLSKGGGFYLMTTYFNFDGLFQFIKPRRRI